MKFNSNRSLTSLIVLAMMGTMALAQDEPKSEEPEAPAPKLNSIKLGYSGLWVTGNRNRARNLGTPHSGFTVEELMFFTPGSEVAPYSKFIVRDVPHRDYWMGGSAISGGGKFRANFETNHRRYQLNGLTPISPSDDRTTRVTVEHTSNLSTHFVSFEDSQRRVNQELPKDPASPRTQRITLGADKQFGGVHAGVVAAQSRMVEGTGAQPNTVSQYVGGHLTADLGKMATVTGTAGYTKVRQAGLKDSSLRSVGLVADIDLGDRTTLRLDISRQDMAMPNVRTAYDRQRFSTGARLNTKLGGWAFQAGFRHRESERVRTSRTFVDVPSWNTYDARLTKQIGGGTRFTLRGSWDDLTESATPNTSDPRQFLWDDKAMAQAKLDFFRDNYSLAGYASYTFRFRQNKARATNLDWHNITAGASKLVTEKLNVYGEASYDFFRGGGANTGTNDRLSDYFADSANIGAGFGLSISDTASLTAGFNAFSTNNIWGHQLSATYRRELQGDRAFELTLAPWSTTDRLYGQSGYRATFVSVNYSLKF